jgi:hypothetical protein
MLRASVGGIPLRPLTDPPRVTSLGSLIGAYLPREVCQEVRGRAAAFPGAPHQVGGAPTLSLSATRARRGAQPSQEVTRSPCAAMRLRRPNGGRISESCMFGIQVPLRRKLRSPD